MGCYHGIVFLVGATLLLTIGKCQPGCKGTDGRDGEIGIPGRDGWPGLKGKKGEPAVKAEDGVDPGLLLMLKGEMGGRGSQGAIGPKGFGGNHGAAGQPGEPGHPGPDGRSVRHGQHSSHQGRSAFSVIRSDRSYPPFGKVVTYQTTVVNEHNDFDQATGYFRCGIPGVYYFTFQSAAKVSMCLYLASEALPEKLGFCDNSMSSDQVLSGGAVLELTVGQKVWLESFRGDQTDSQSRDTQAKQIIFNGFLLFSNPA